MSTQDPADVVRSYLAAMERRDLAAAQALLAPGFVMTFPGGKRFESLEQLVAWARPRYRRALKHYDRYDAAPQPDGSAVVYCFGTLHGELVDGAPYQGIRFIDRFTVRDGRLVDQMVWNDMAEVLGRLGPTPS
jgi:ketosteroid isomerase-like protein